MDSIFSNLNESELKFKAEIEDFLDKEVGPYVNDVEEGKKEIWDVIRQLGKKGYIGISTPKRFGGTGGTLKQELIFSEALCYHSLPIDMSRFSSMYPALLIQMFGKNRLLKHYTEALCKGEMIGAFCFTEPEAGSDLGRMQTIAKYDEAKDEFIINGEKRFITNGSVANLMVVYARNGGFLVESKFPGFKVIEEYRMMGLHGLHLGHMLFENVRVPKDNVLFYKPIKEGAEKKTGKTDAIAGLQNMLGPERMLLSAQALGVAHRALNVAIQYSKERVQFKKPIYEFEGVSFKIAKMLTYFEAAKALVDKAVNNMEDTTLSAMAKLFSCQSAFKICDNAVQILGGIGYTNKYPVERCQRDVRLLRIGGGTDQIMKYIIQKDLYSGAYNKDKKKDESTPKFFSEAKETDS